ncbi:MAG: NAD(P)-dependent oxidoreductase [Pseudomonadota bacterium]
MEKIGVVGLGAMGLPMAKTLAASSFDVIGFDVSAPRRARFDPCAASIDGLADRDAVVLSLPNDAVVSDVAGQLFDRLSRGATIIDTSTVAPATTRGLQDRAAQHGIGYVDAPVSGGAAGAEMGTLLVMAGGRPEDIQRVHIVLDALARSVVVCGGPGAGNVVKLINNMMCAGHLILAGEALRLADEGGVATDELVNALNAGSGRSAVTEVNLPRWVLSDTFDSAFSMALMTKDVGLAAHLDGAGPVAREVAGRWQRATDEIGGAEDFNRMAKHRVDD